MSNNIDTNKEAKVQISLYATKLKNVAGTFKGVSDPYAVVTLLAGGVGEQPNVLGKTEVIKNNLNPAWTTSFTTTYTFGKETRFNVGVYDEVKKTNKSIPMGSAMFEIGEILGAYGNIKAKKLKNGGTLFARVTKAADVDHGTLDLVLRGIKLKNVDGIFSKSDPFFVIKAQSESPGGRVWQPVYRSETIQNDLNPLWKEFTIPMEKICGGDKYRPIQFEVYDWEKNGKHQPMGKFQTNVNALINAQVIGGATGDPKKVSLTGALKLLQKGKDFGQIVVARAEIKGNTSSSATASNSRSAATSNYAPGSTPPKKFITANGINKLNPEYKKWRAAQTATDSTPSASATPTPSTTAAVTPMPPAIPAPTPMPDFSTALNNPPPANNAHPNSYQATFPPPLAPPSQSTASFAPSVAPTAPSFSKLAPTKPKFVDYISGGTEINLAVAIDFTGSNGDPRKYGTLHYIHPDGQMNDYEKALTAVGSIVARYDSDQMFPVLGFGAKYGGVIQHCFQVGKAKELKGVKGMVEGYRQVFKTGLTMSGPTVFADVIQYAASQAQRKQNENQAIGKQAYSILLILTDGAVTDIEQTKTAIRNASNTPLSIVIVGVGQADFSRMQFLDDFQRDEGGATRDIVQFVEFSRHAHSRRSLTEETLDEIPDQLVDYFYERKIMPLPPVSGSKLNIFEEEYNENEDIQLNMAFASDGEIKLDNPMQATFDAHSYGKASNFLPPAMAPPASGKQSYSRQSYVAPNNGYGAPAPNNGYGARSPNNGYGAPATNNGYGAPAQNGYGAPAPAAPNAYGNQYGGQHHRQSYVGQSSPPRSQLRQQQHQQQQSPPRQPYGAPPVAIAQPTNIIHVRAPPNAYPGMKVQVQNPTTGQMQIVAIPHGVAPGGTFAVNV